MKFEIFRIQTGQNNKKTLFHMKPGDLDMKHIDNTEHEGDSEAFKIINDYIVKNDFRLLNVNNYNRSGYDFMDFIIIKD